MGIIITDTDDLIVFGATLKDRIFSGLFWFIFLPVLLIYFTMDWAPFVTLLGPPISVCVGLYALFESTKVIIDKKSKIVTVKKDGFMTKSAMEIPFSALKEIKISFINDGEGGEFRLYLISHYTKPLDLIPRILFMTYADKSSVERTAEKIRKITGLEISRNYYLPSYDDLKRKYMPEV